ncbi:hypothetical protein [Shimia ponticola]|uniref:hypothetical protein n=1 Tax=Shimia ponticola TaxID=2582893 RepID=UPI0011BE1DDC|nr:hypothetical protein [Shimia ponticola]
MEHQMPSQWRTEGPNGPGHAYTGGLHWKDMLVADPHVHATLCQKDSGLATSPGQTCIEVPDFDPARLADDSAFLNQLVTLDVQSIELPIHDADEYALRTFCLAVLSRSPDMVIHLAPTSPDDAKPAESVCVAFPGQVIMAQSRSVHLPDHRVPVRERFAASPQPRTEASAPAPSVTSTSSPSYGGVAARALEAISLPAGMPPRIAISRSWSLSLHDPTTPAAIQSAALGYALVRNKSTKSKGPWVPFATASVGSTSQRLIGLRQRGEAFVPQTGLQTRPSGCAKILLAQAPVAFAPGDFVLDEAGCFVGIICEINASARGSDPEFDLTILPVTAIWEDLSARADLGSDMACTALSDLSYVRDRVIHPKPRRAPAQQRAELESLA